MRRRILWTPAAPGDVSRMASHVRPEDKDEWAAVAGPNANTTFAERLKRAHALSRKCWAARDPANIVAVPFALYGVCDTPDSPDWGTIWMVATPKVKRFARAFLRDTPGRIQYIHDQGWYPKGLHNFVDTRNKLHMKWLSRIGAIIPQGQVTSLSGVPFQYFRLESCVIQSPLP